MIESGSFLFWVKNLDLVYTTLVLFSILFFAYVIRTAYKGINKMVVKERNISKIEEKYNRLRDHRANLMVNQV